MSIPERRKSDLSRRTLLGTLAGLPAAAGAGISWLRGAADEKPAETPRVDCDVFVYGSTPGGIAAAVEAARRGLKVVLACPQKYPGGMAASGLCTTDAVRRHLFGGIVAEFVGRVRAYYVKTLGEQHPDFALIKDGWYYEPSVAERVFGELIAGESERLRYLRGTHVTSAVVERGRIANVTLEGAGGGSFRIAARTYIDGTYEGDLAAAAKVPYVVGREGCDEFGESFAGIHYMNFKTGKQIMTADSGEPSPAIQAFCARCVLTTDPAKRMAIEKPATYDEHLPDYSPLLEDFASGRLKRWSNGTPFPGGKREFNGNIEWKTSLNLPGVSWTWPEADRHHRARLAQFHVDHAAGLFWFLQNDPHVPEAIREQMKPLGRHPQEFVDHGGWPWQIYVRQGRRIRGRAIVTQNNFIVDPKTGKTPTVEQPIALGEHSFDVHPCHDRRFAVEDFMEGVLWYPKKAFGPAQPGQIPWGALLPKGVDNLVVPVALSCTHVAMSVLRMEPVWMTLGQIAGLAAAVAKEKSTDVASIDPEPLPRVLKILTVPTAS